MCIQYYSNHQTTNMLLKILYTVSFLDGLAFSTTISAQNPYVYSLNGTQFYLGVLGSVTAFINLIWSPIVGSISDTVGRKKALLQCLLVCVVGNLLIPFSNSLTVYFISRIFTSFGTQIITLLKSLIDDNIKKQDDKMAAINKMGAVAGLTFILGPLLSGHLSEYVSGYRLVFGIISLMYSVNLVLILTITDHQHKKTKTESFNLLSEVRKASGKLSNLNWTKYWDLYVLKLTLEFIFSILFFTFAENLMQRFGITGKLFGYVFASMGVIGIITNLSLSKLQKKFYSDDKSGFQRLLHCCILMIYTVLGQGYSPNFTLYFVHLIPMSIVRTVLDSTLTEVILRRASPDEKGSIMGTFETTFSLGGIFAPIVAGTVADLWGNEVLTLLCVVPLIFGTVLAYSQKRKIKVG